MLPNWLYGKSLRKLQEILNGGGQTAAGVSYSNTESGLEATNAQDAIDEVVAEVNTKAAQSTVSTLSDTVTTLTGTVNGKAALTQITNPNLIDNPWFTVNQRGQSSYTGTGARYTVDRWQASSGNSNVTVNSDSSITLYKGAAGAMYLRETLEDSVIQKLVGKTITLSCSIKNATGLACIARIRFGDSSDAHISSLYINELVNGINTVTGVVPDNTAKAYIEFYETTSEDSTASITIEAAKLELGSVSTLAMDTAPNYVTELLKCQRYFYRLNLQQYTSMSLGIANTDASCIATFILPTTMRIKPTVTCSDVTKLILRHGSTQLINTVTQLVVYGNNARILNLVLTATGLTLADIYDVYYSSTGDYIDFSADL